ncbi:SUMO activating enzyme 1B, ARABIDOPSIS THALIANA SUMO ACTIVATING ENZYME 1B [Hibiscus trionum]|uniref:SUMO activating enzyme 1B, ARABIDOPSIS THALIANA SUMO ACTIVATING ENZYME 1B n=1 Tax=Hibiscus trionum TaxID=183268 RepID=A0A9W7MMD4_HIBTR|nr:SUMO activating enzyme 1B, ARABIDOPSIS THALIANA SUMO ACTIVATING ENZYME 1B [Hibiscus trionum]
MNGEELTEQETALYDRQIRVWGADAQRRLSKSHILVYGMKGTVAEFCKNIVLAGVGSVTLVDDRAVTEEALSANFLILPDENLYNGKTLAEVCCDSLKEFNPMVHVSVEKGDVSTFGLEFFEKFDAVVTSCCSLTKKKKLEETIECQLEYPSFEDATTVPWKALPKRVSKLYFAMREQFEDVEGRIPGETSTADLPGVLKLRKELCETNSMNESQIPDALLERLLIGTSEYPPVCAIIGGILGQEVIKAISGKGDPLKNFFFFDAMDGKGLIEDISKP